MFLINLSALSSAHYCLDSTNPLQIPDLIDIKVEESEEEDEVEDPVVEPERAPSLPSPIGMPVINMQDISKVRLRSRDPPQKKSPTEDTKEGKEQPAKPAWMNDLKQDNRRSVGIFLERQELSHIRYLYAIVNVNVRKECFSRQNIFKVSCI